MTDIPPGRSVAELRPHPENVTIFGDPEESEQFDAVLASVRQFGIWEPLAIRADGTILSGHLRFAVALKLKLKRVPVRVVEAFATYRDEVTFIIRSNTDRRQLTPGEIALAFKRLRELPKEQGGTKKKQGGDRKSAAAKNQSGPASTLKARDEAAKILGVGPREARALETVFTTSGVPKALKDAVNSGAVAPTPAAKSVRAEVERQGGTIKDGAALKAIAEPPKKAAPAETHESRVAANAAAFDRDYRELFEIYKKLSSLLTRRPLKTVLGPTEHHRYMDLIRDTSLRAWRRDRIRPGADERGAADDAEDPPGGRIMKMLHATAENLRASALLAPAVRRVCNCGQKALCYSVVKRAAEREKAKRHD